MRSRALRAAGAVAIAGLLILQNGVHIGGAPTAKAVTYAALNEIQDRLLSGMADLELNPTSAAIAQQSQTRNYTPRGNETCDSNVKGNRSGRARVYAASGSGAMSIVGGAWGSNDGGAAPVTTAAQASVR